MYSETVQLLRDHADAVTAGARQTLERAAELYEQERDLLRAAMQRKDAFLGPWSGKEIGDWTPEIRQREHDILMECRRIEAAAAGELDKALAAEKVNLPALPADARAAAAVTTASASQTATPPQDRAAAIRRALEHERRAAAAIGQALAQIE